MWADIHLVTKYKLANGKADKLIRKLESIFKEKEAPKQPILSN